MATHEFELGIPPVDERSRELWLQHAAGFILFEDVRAEAATSLDPSLDPGCRAVALKAIDKAVYALMMVADGVTGGLRNGDDAVEISISVRLRRGGELVQELALSQGDGMCMGYHGWLQEDFGEDPVAHRRE